MEEQNRELLAKGLQAYGLSPGPESYQALIRHLEMVAHWNERVNLTAIVEEREMVIKHVLDSAAVFGVVEPRPGMRVVDVGTGAGFPGVTLKCIAPRLSVVLLESLAKRCKFLEAVGDDVIAPLAGGVDGYRVVWSRAEDAGQAPQHREQYDLATARAVAELRVLAEYCLPLVKVGGLFVAMKGPGVGEELAAAQRAVQLLGGQFEEIVEVALPEDAGVRSLVPIRKVRATPEGYPRKAGMPAKNPL